MTDKKPDGQKNEELADLEPTADPKAGADLTSTTPAQQILIGMLLPAVQKIRE